jgi:CRISPR-associated protein Csx16
MAVYFISRHIGAIEWAKQQCLEIDQWVEHLSLQDIRPGDIVVGSLPIHLVAQLNVSGARYLHLTIKLPASKRGQELSTKELEEFGACLTEFDVTELPTEDMQNVK